MSKIAFLYPGQGAQKAGMGADFYVNSAAASEIFDMATELLGFDMTELCFEKDDRLDQTEYTQAAMVTTCLAMTKVLENAGITPDVTAGLSLGEYCAIAAAGGMSYKDAIKTVRTRGILMQNAVPLGKGTMAAVLGMNAEAIENVLSEMENVTIANYNCPGQIVITGKTEAVKAACEKLKEAGARRTLPLNVSGPFHSPMQKKAGEALRETLDEITWQPLAVPYVTNVTAEAVTDITAAPELLEKQVNSPVCWQQSVEYMIENGTDIFVEIGPGKTLTGFLKKIAPEASVYQVNTWEDVEKVAEILKK